MTFFYTGSAQVNDNMKVYALDNQGAWDELANIAGTVGRHSPTGKRFQTTTWATPHH